jgi:hypothetical protein
MREISLVERLSAGVDDYRGSATRVSECQLMLYTGTSASDESGHAMLVVAVVAVAALVVLAGRLPGDPEPGSDLWPPDALIYGSVDKRCEFRLCLVPHVPGVLDPLKHLGRRQAGDALRRACGFCWRLLPPPRLHVLDPRTRPALRLAHGIQHAAHV